MAKAFTAAFVLVAALLLALAPQDVLAHGGHPEESSAVPAAAQAPAAVLPTSSQWSAPCTPGSGHLCTCRNLALGDGGAKNPAVVPAGLHRTAVPPAWRAKLPPVARPLSRSSLSIASPRAPPA